jgi:hypothetical protein
MHDDAILEQSLECLAAHRHPEWGDQLPIDIFNRLLAKNVRPAGWTTNTHFNIQRHQIRSRREKWSTDELAKLCRGHADSTGIDFGCPIVLAEYDGKLRVLDGNHRINRWVANSDARVHDVNIHSVTAPGRYVELAPVKSA